MKLSQANKKKSTRNFAERAYIPQSIYSSSRVIEGTRTKLAIFLLYIKKESERREQSLCIKL